MVWPERRRGEVGRWGRGVEKAKKREEVLLNQRQSKGESWGKREKKKKVFDCRYEEEKKSDFFDMSEDDVLSKVDFVFFLFLFFCFFVFLLFCFFVFLFFFIKRIQSLKGRRLHFIFSRAMHKPPFGNFRWEELGS